MVYVMFIYLDFFFCSKCFGVCCFKKLKNARSQRGNALNRQKKWFKKTKTDYEEKRQSVSKRLPVLPAAFFDLFQSQNINN